MTRRQKLPRGFQDLYWWGDVSKLHIKEQRRTIIVQIVNYGRWEHWKWMIRTFGKVSIKKILSEIPASEFRSRALRLLSLLLGIKKLKYASRSDYISAKRDFAKT